MQTVLVVEDSPIVVKVLRKLINDQSQFLAHYAASYAEAKQLLEQAQHNYFAAIVDLNLPDATNGEAVSLTLENDVPTVVLTGTFDEGTREYLFGQGIVDYVVKESRYAYEYAVGLLNRLNKNQHIDVLIVEDSKTTRRMLVKMLEGHLFKVHQAENGMQALELLQQLPNIQLMLTDYQMPEMDGFELVVQVRRSMNKSDFVIIGLSAEGNPSLSAKFIKNGANDFLKKPFRHEELYCRVSHNLEEMELIQAVRELAHKDYLTGLYNRRYFYEVAEQQIQQCQKNSAQLSIAVIDIDYFKQVNDQYGHEAGDEVLKYMASLLMQCLPSFICARFGGEEFVVLFPRVPIDRAAQLIDQVREQLSGSRLRVLEQELNISFSAGLAVVGEQIDPALAEADQRLYRAKEAGRNIVIFED